MGDRTIMIIGAGVEQCLGIRVAHNMGLRVLATDVNPRAPGSKEADFFKVASTYDYERTYEAAIEHIAEGGRIDGVLTLAADVPYTVAFIANKLGLHSIDIEAALNTSDKIRMKKVLNSMGVPVPNFKEITHEDELEDIVREIGFPLVVKPSNNRGARGVQIVKEKIFLKKAYSYALNYTESGKILVEEYLEGPQLSVEGFILNGEAYIPAIFDRNYEYLDRFAPYIIENGGEMPSIFYEERYKEVQSIMKKAALALGIDNSIIKGDLVIHNDRIKVIEIASRLSGGFFGTVATPVSCGLNFIELNINLALSGGLDPKKLKPQFQKGAAIRFAFPPTGRVHKIEGLDSVLKDTNCCFACVFVKEGDIIPPITDHTARPAVVVAKGFDTKDAASNASKLINNIKFEIHKEHA